MKGGFLERYAQSPGDLRAGAIHGLVGRRSTQRRRPARLPQVLQLRICCASCRKKLRLLET